MGNSNIGKQQLKAMEGTVSIVNLGLQLEYAPLQEIQDFESYTGTISPYVSLGFQYNFYNVKSSSTMGELGSKQQHFPNI